VSVTPKLNRGLRFSSASLRIYIGALKPRDYYEHLDAIHSILCCAYHHTIVPVIPSTMPPINVMVDNSEVLKEMILDIVFVSVIFEGEFQMNLNLEKNDPGKVYLG
jgi:hypothetical protein